MCDYDTKGEYLFIADLFQSSNLFKEYQKILCSVNIDKIDRPSKNMLKLVCCEKK